ncbi:MAG: hypothetical protein IT547_19530, partial [Hyphomonadaceae bacterium]|nr:hypothetical protein [Hyphomonadaceae bacterium]
MTISTGIPVRDDPRAILARQRTGQLNEQLQAFWRSDRQSPSHLDAISAIQRAQALNLPIITTTDAIDLSLGDLWQRFVRVVGERPPVPKPDNEQLTTAAQVVFGIPPTSQEKKPTIRVSGMLAEYERINATAIATKSPLQRRKWLQQRQSALDLFLRLIGEDCAVEDLSTKHAHAFRAHWQDRVLKGKVTSASANREMRQLSGLYSAIRSFHQFDVKNPFSCLNIRGDGDGKRVAFDPKFVRDEFLAEGRLAGLNAEARRIVYLIIETGLRLSEACALTEERIHLGSPIPFIEVTANGRRTKTRKSIRKIPLVGVALKA